MSPKRDWCAALQSLKDLKGLPENWDGEESPGTDPGIWESANKFLFKLLGKVPPPFVCPIPGGTLQLEWTVGEKHLEIEFADKDVVYVLVEDATGTKPILESHEIPLNEHGRIMEYLAWLTGCDSAVTVTLIILPASVQSIHNSLPPQEFLFITPNSDCN